MNIELLETFLDLCDSRSFNRTANRLGVTQSTVSARVQALERKLGCRLLTRSRAGTDLTTAGLRFEPHARSMRAIWSTAAQEATGEAAVSMRIGIQHDLMGANAAVWVETVQGAIAEVALYIESDFSPQTCLDVLAGRLDLGVVFTPRPHPDLYFETVGEVGYRMVSTGARQLEEVDPAQYILANYAPAFASTHAALLPELSAGTISSGQNTVVRGLLVALGGTTYVLDETAEALIEAGAAQAVTDAPRITQPVYAVMQARARHRGPFRRLVKAISARVRDLS